MVEWVFIDEEGVERGTSEEFATQSEAEAWFSAAWGSLAAAGTASVTLRATDSGEELYRMSLAAE